MPLRVKVVACVCALALVGLGGWMALRDSGLFAVEHVTVDGLSADASPALRADLAAAARAQTTTDFSVIAVRAAVARYTLVADVRAQTHIPHGVTLIVTERHAVARLDVDGHSIPIAADGSTIVGLVHAPHIATVTSTQQPVAGRSRDPFVAVALRVLTAAPKPLRRRVVAVTLSGDGLTLHLHRGPRLIFGDGTLPHAKWDAAAAVLADPSSRGASYVDVRMPSRPTAQVGDAQTSAAAVAASDTSGGPPLAAATVATTFSPTTG